MAWIIPFGGRSPRIAKSAFVAPTAVVIGDVVVGASASVWFGAVLRGDHSENGIRIGARSNVQENSVVHTSETGPHRAGGGGDGRPRRTHGELPHRNAYGGRDGAR